MTAAETEGRPGKGEDGRARTREVKIACLFAQTTLDSEGRPVLHLNDISPTDQPQRLDSGVIDHVAFGSRGFEAMKKHLGGKGVPYRVNQVPNSTRWQIFFRDPNNVEIELNFETKNEIAA